MTNQADDTPEVGADLADDDHGERLAVLEQLESGLERPMQVVASLNRGMRSLSASMGRRGLGYVVVPSGGRRR